MSLKRLLIVLVVIAIALFLYSTFIESIFSPRLSPKETVKYEFEGVDFKVQYNRPSKRDREIFGALVPFDKVWRTGANEATTFENSKDIMVDGMLLPKGVYTIWSVPHATYWTIMFNSKQYAWGVDEEMKPMWDPNYDVLELDATVIDLDKTIEKFTMAFETDNNKLQLTLAWDKTKIAIPIDINTNK